MIPAINNPLVFITFAFLFWDFIMLSENIFLRYLDPTCSLCYRPHASTYQAICQLLFLLKVFPRETYHLWGAVLNSIHHDVNYFHSIWMHKHSIQPSTFYFPCFTSELQASIQQTPRDTNQGGLQIRNRRYGGCFPQNKCTHGAQGGTQQLSKGFLSILSFSIDK